MVRGMYRDQNENKVISRACIDGSEKRFSCTDQTAKRFMHKVDLWFVEKFFDTSKVPERNYGFISLLGIKKHFSDFPEDVPNFVLSVEKLRASNLTRVGDKEIMYIPVENQMGFTQQMNFICQNFDKNSWQCFKDYLVLKHHPKWDETPDL